jgi:hypothetical protein
MMDVDAASLRCVVRSVCPGWIGGVGGVFEVV